MTRILNISKVAVAVLAVCSLLVASCGKPNVENGTLEVSLKSSSVASQKGQVFVSVKCASSWTLSLTDDSGEGIDWATVNPSSGQGDKNNVILSYQVNTDENNRELLVVLDNGKSKTSCSLIQAGAGKHPVEDPDEPEVPEQPDQPSQPQDPGTGATKVSWLELPSMDDTSLEYYSHSFSMNGKKYRNYTFGWSQNDLVALWVAYPLCSTYTNKTVSRTNAWAYDPLLGSNKSAAPFGGYGDDYARGHQLPSADRLCCYEANAQTFYGTNMTPQLNEHNEGIWSNMETFVRNVANTSDTTYVVTGCVVKGSTKFTKDSDGKKMTVPVAYYKVLLRYSKSSTISTWAAMAFYTEHKNYTNTSLSSLAMSVDALEQKLGMDFFVNLPAQLGQERAAALEAENPLNNKVWGW